MAIKTYEKNAQWGAEIILEDLSKIIPEEAKKDSQKFLHACSQIAQKAKLLLKKLKKYEENEKKRNSYIDFENEKSVTLYLHYSQAKGGQELQRIMIEAYAFVAFLRKWITTTSIDYIVAFEQSKGNLQVLHMTLKDIIENVNLGVSSSKGFKLSLSPMGMTTEKLKEVNRFKNFEKDLKDIESNLLQILQKVETRANKKAGQATVRTMHNFNINGSKLNKGFVTETAVNMYAVYGLAAKNIKDPAKLAEAYISTVGNLPGFRGGDINELMSKRFLETEGTNFEYKVEFQVKRVAGLFGASVIEINTLKYELANIYILLQSLEKQGAIEIRKKLFEYFTDQKKTAYDTFSLLKQNLNIVFQDAFKEIKRFMK